MYHNHKLTEYRSFQKWKNTVLNTVAVILRTLLSVALKVDANCALVSLTEKPSLQSRHSLDSSRTQERETGPLWITLALQKQKGFREQQQSREERKNQREAKLAEKQARDRESVSLRATHISVQPVDPGHQSTQYMTSLRISE